MRTAEGKVDIGAAAFGLARDADDVNSGPVESDRGTHGELVGCRVVGVEDRHIGDTIGRGEVVPGGERARRERAKPGMGDVDAIDREGLRNTS